MGTENEAGTHALRLKEEFPPVPTPDWEAVIQADLKGADYEKKLVWRTDEGISVRPYFRTEHASAVLNDRRLDQTWKMVEPQAEPPAGAIRADLVHEHGGTAVHELAFAVSEGVQRLEKAGDVQTINVVFSIGSNFFFEIAKLRAARILWDTASGAFQSACKLRVHARTALSNKSIYDPYTNLLRATTEALSAVIGGCDSLQVRSFRFPDRLAMNVQRILKEESHMDRVADPAGGAYYIEWLTDSLAREAWKLFQQIDAGTITVDAVVEQARAARQKAIESRRKTLVGVNNYPDLQEVVDEPVRMPKGIWRAASVFEDIRLRTEAHANRTGRRPKILLLERGDLKMRQARSQFCQNFFGCGGFAIEVASDYAGTDADLIVLCSSDPEYLALAQEVCPAVKQPVIVAGNPKEAQTEMKAAGVQGFVHVGSNAAETLTDWQSRLGIGVGKE